MRRLFTLLLSAICILGMETSSYSESVTPEPSPGVIHRIGTAMSHFFSQVGKLVHNPNDPEDSDEEIVKKKNKTSAELIRQDAKVTDRLHREYVGPPVKEPKPTVDLEAVQNKIAPLPEPEKISQDTTKDLSIRKGMAKNAALDNMKNESQRIEEIDNKILNGMPQAKLATTLNAEKSAEAPHSMGALEADFSNGHPNKN